MGETACVDHTGDTKIIWSKDNADEVEVARTSGSAHKIWVQWHG